jgi:hypothetical protein
MNETRETANADVYQAISRLVEDFACRRAKKDQNVPCCRRRFCRVPGETPGLMNHRVRPVI